MVKDIHTRCTTIKNVCNFYMALGVLLVFRFLCKGINRQFYLTKKILQINNQPKKYRNSF